MLHCQTTLEDVLFHMVSSFCQKEAFEVQEQLKEIDPDAVYTQWDEMRMQFGFLLNANLVTQTGYNYLLDQTAARAEFVY